MPARDPFCWASAESSASPTLTKQRPVGAKSSRPPWWWALVGMPVSRAFGRPPSRPGCSGGRPGCPRPTSGRRTRVSSSPGRERDPEQPALAAARAGATPATSPSRRRPCPSASPGAAGPGPLRDQRVAVGEEDQSPTGRPGRRRPCRRGPGPAGRPASACGWASEPTARARRRRGTAGPVEDGVGARVLAGAGEHAARRGRSPHPARAPAASPATPSSRRRRSRPEVAGDIPRVCPRPRRDRRLGSSGALRGPRRLSSPQAAGAAVHADVPELLETLCPPPAVPCAVPAGWSGRSPPLVTLAVVGQASYAAFSAQGEQHQQQPRRRDGRAERRRQRVRAVLAVEPRSPARRVTVHRGHLDRVAALVGEALRHRRRHHEGAGDLRRLDGHAGHRRDVRLVLGLHRALDRLHGLLRAPSPASPALRRATRTGVGSWSPTGNASGDPDLPARLRRQPSTPDTAQGGTATFGLTWEAQNS